MDPAWTSLSIRRHVGVVLVCCRRLRRTVSSYASSCRVVLRRGSRCYTRIRGCSASPACVEDPASRTSKFPRTRGGEPSRRLRLMWRRGNSSCAVPPSCIPVSRTVNVVYSASRRLVKKQPTMSLVVAAAVSFGLYYSGVYCTAQRGECPRNAKANLFLCLPVDEGLQCLRGLYSAYTSKFSREVCRDS